jgi:hypothetical protein
MGRDLMRGTELDAAVDPAPFEIVDAGDSRVATNGTTTLQIHVPEGGRVFRRRAVKVNHSKSQARVEWAVAELDGVRVYFDGTNVVVTRRDLMP